MEELSPAAAPSWFPAESGAAAAPPAPVASPAPAECSALACDLPLLGPAPIPAAEATGLVEDEDAPNETTVGQRVGRARAKPQRLSDSVDAGKSYAPAPPSAGARQWHFNRRMRPKRRRAPPDSPEPVEQWHTTGSDLLRLKLSRPVDDDGSLVNAIVVSWLPASESDFVDDDGKPAALYKIRYLDGELAGDHEDLEAHEVEESIGESIPMATLPQPAASRVEPRKPPPPDSHPGRLIDPRECPDTVEVNFVATNPKRPGSASYRRYEAYKDATTVKEFLEKGGWRADLVHDVNKNYCALGGAAPDEREDTGSSRRSCGTRDDRRQGRTAQQLEAAVMAASTPETPETVTEAPAAEDPTQAKAVVIGWLPKEESDFLDDEGRPAALYRIRYVSGDLAGDIEDLEEHEVRASVPYEDRVRLAEKEQIIFEEAEARGLDAKAVTPPHYVAPRSPPRVMLPLVPDSDSDDSEDSEDSDVDWAPPTPVPMREVDLRAATFAGSYQDADDDDVAPLPKRRKIAVGDRVTLTLDPLEGVVTKTGSGWYTVKFEFGGVDNFRADELRVL